MSTVYVALRTRLVALSSLTALTTTTRVYQEKAPTKAVLPYVTFTLIANPNDHHLTAASAFAKPTFQIDCWSSDRDERHTMAEAIRDGIDGYSATVATIDIRSITLTDKGRDSSEELGDGSQGHVYRTSIDAEVWYAQTAPSLP